MSIYLELEGINGSLWVDLPIWRGGGKRKREGELTAEE